MRASWLGGAALAAVLGMGFVACGGDSFSSSGEDGTGGSSGSSSGGTGAQAGTSGEGGASGSSSGRGGSAQGGSAQGGSAQGGSAGQGGFGGTVAGSAGMGAQGGSGGGTEPVCPPGPPSPGAACSDDLYCEYPGDCCSLTFACENGTWQEYPCPGPQPVCPDTPPAPGSDCSCLEGLFCEYDSCDATGMNPKIFELDCQDIGGESIWKPSERACPLRCGPNTCGHDQVCLVFGDPNAGSGEFFCVNNPCPGSAELDCECVAASNLCGSLSCLGVENGNTLLCGMNDG